MTTAMRRGMSSIASVSHSWLGGGWLVMEETEVTVTFTNGGTEKTETKRRRPELVSRDRRARRRRNAGVRLCAQPTALRAVAPDGVFSVSPSFTPFLRL